MTIVPPSANYLLSQIETLLPKAISVLGKHEWRYAQTVFFKDIPHKCWRLHPLAQTSWKQRSLALRQDGELCIIWGWMDYVNGKPRPVEPTGRREKRQWFIQYHAFGEIVRDRRKLSHDQLGILTYELDDIVDPRYSGYSYPIWAQTASSGVSSVAVAGRVKAAKPMPEKVNEFLLVFGRGRK